MLLEPKTYLWFGMSLLLNAAASVTNTFGPIILNGLGYDKYRTSLLNIPFGAIQWVVIMVSSIAAQRFRVKSVVLVLLTLPPIAGTVMLYVLPRTAAQKSPLLVGYYLLAIMYGVNPIIVTWIVGNTAGTTKKSAVMAIYNAGSSAGQIIGPLLFNAKDAPAYLPGLRAVLGIFVALAACAVLQVANLLFLNRLQSKRRVNNGKPAHIQDTSMEDRYEAVDDDAGGIVVDSSAGGGCTGGSKPDQAADAVEVGGAAHTRIGDNAFLDLTDRQNDEFVSILSPFKPTGSLLMLLPGLYLLIRPDASPSMYVGEAGTVARKVVPPDVATYPVGVRVGTQGVFVQRRHGSPIVRHLRHQPVGTRYQIRTRLFFFLSLFSLMHNKGAYMRIKSNLGHMCQLVLQSCCSHNIIRPL